MRQVRRLKLYAGYMLLLLLNISKSEDINPQLKTILEKLDLDEKYHRMANDIYKKADREMSQDENNPLKHLEGLNSSVRRLLRSITRPEKLAGTNTEVMGKKILNFASEELEKYFVAEPELRAEYNMSDSDIVKFKRLFEDTKKCVEKLSLMFNCA